jgi:hypothetical protein
MAPQYLSATLGSLPLSIQVDTANWGRPTKTVNRTRNALADRQLETVADGGAPRTYAFTARLRGATMDDLLAQVHALEIEVGKPTNTLVVQPPGASRPSTFVIEQNDWHELPYNVVLERGYVAMVPVELTGHPWAYGQPVSVPRNYATTPAILDLAVDLGEAPAPLTLACTAPWATSTDGLAQVVVGLVGDDDTLDGLVYEAEDATSYVPGHWSAAHDDYCSGDGNNVRHLGSTDAWIGLGWDRAPRAGRYRAYARAKVPDGDPATLCLGGDYGDALKYTEVDGTDWALYDLGEWCSDGEQPLAISGITTVAGHYVYVDRVVLFPLDRGGRLAFGDGVEVTGYIVETVTLGWQDASYTIYAPHHGHGITLPGLAYMQGSGLKALGPAPALAWACDDTGTQIDPALNVQLSYTPRYIHWVTD